MTLRLLAVLVLLLHPAGPSTGSGEARAAAAADDKAASGKPPKIKSKVKVSEKSGFHRTPFQVALSTELSGATIFFTLDGRVPSPHNGRRYSQPIRIETTTTLRAAGYGKGARSEPAEGARPEPAEGSRVTEIDTHTFLFVSNVLKQTGAGAPSTWGTNQNQAVPADYEMDPEIVQDPAYRNELAAALESLPSVSVVMDAEELFGPTRGIYANPRQSGDDWERVASLEFMPDDGKGFQIDCGIRIQGGWNRRPEESPKHAFRVAFRKKYGAGKLRFPLFEEKGSEEFDTLILRAGCNNTWLHWNGLERKRGDYLRDQWMRDSYAAMGHPSARGRFVHLYLNGLYWGLYNLVERPDERFAADHFGGSASSYDARNGENVISGDDMAWKRLIALANAGVGDETSYQAVPELLELPAFIDFMILNLYGGNADWDRASNWYAARRRQPPGPFHFFVWDGERTLEQVEANTLAFDDDQSPPRLFQKLRANEEFRVMFGDHVQRHLGKDGALAPGPAAARFQSAAKRLDPAIVAESARWGDYRRDVHPYKEGPYELYTRDRHWRPEIQRVLKEFFPDRTQRVIGQFREAGLYPPPAAPDARRDHGTLALSVPAGAIYYTDDGTDPRLVGGKLSERARRYEKPISAVPGRQINARTFLKEGNLAQWSALVTP